ILKRHLVGEGERVGGYLHKVIDAVLLRSQVRSALADLIGRVSLRRQAVDDVSAAITQVIAKGDGTSKAIRTLLKSNRNGCNGLDSAPQWDIGIPSRVGGLQVVHTKNLPVAAEPDY